MSDIVETKKVVRNRKTSPNIERDSCTPKLAYELPASIHKSAQRKMLCKTSWRENREERSVSEMNVRKEWVNCSPKSSLLERLNLRAQLRVDTSPPRDKQPAFIQLVDDIF